MKKLLSLTLVTATLGACGSKAKTKSADSGELAIIVSNKANPFFTSMTSAATEQANKYSMPIMVFDSANATDKELANVKTAISKGAKAILINVVNSKTNNAVKFAQSKGVKVIALDRKVEGVDVVGTIFTDNNKAAKDLGAFVQKWIDDKNFGYATSNALQLRGVDSSASTDRDAGFPLGFSKWSGVKKEKADFDRQKGFQTTKTILSTNDKLNIVYAENDEMAMGAVKAFKEKNTKGSLLSNNIVVIGFDGTDDASKAVQDGDMLATVKQRPDNMGRWGVDWAIKSLDKEYKNKETIDGAKNGVLAINGEVVKK